MNDQIIPDSSEPLSGNVKRKTRLMAVGGVFGALAVSSCCVIPLALFGLGISGAWIGQLTALAPYQPIFVVITLGFLGYGYWIVYQNRKLVAPTVRYVVARSPIVWSRMRSGFQRH